LFLFKSWIYKRSEGEKKPKQTAVYTSNFQSRFKLCHYRENLVVWLHGSVQGPPQQADWHPFAVARVQLILAQLEK